MDPSTFTDNNVSINETKIDKVDSAIRHRNKANGTVIDKSHNLNGIIVNGNC